MVLSSPLFESGSKQFINASLFVGFGFAFLFRPNVAYCWGNCCASTSRSSVLCGLRQLLRRLAVAISFASAYLKATEAGLVSAGVSSLDEGEGLLGEE